MNKTSPASSSKGLVDEGLADADCINIDLYAYGLVSTFDKTKRLRLEWKSHEPKPGKIGGEDVFGCEDKQLRPSVSGDR